MKLRQSLFLAIVLVVLVALYFGMQYRRDYRAGQQHLAKQVFSFTPEAVQRLSITRISEKTVTAERTDAATWQITAPNPTILPFHRMWDRVATHLAELTNEHTVLETVADLAAYGLDAPALQIEALLNNGETMFLTFGALEPTQRHRYARLNEGSLFLVGTDTFFELNRSLQDLRHRYLVRDRETPLTRIAFAWIWTDPPREDGARRVETGQESVTIVAERASVDAPWRVVSPFNALARHETIQALANELQFAVCNDFVDEPESLADYGLQPARARLSFTDARGGEEQTLWLGSVDEAPDRQGLYVKVDGHDAVLLIDGHLLTLLPSSPVEWRDLRLLTRRVSDIKELTYTTANDRFVLTKDAEQGWRLTEPELESINEFAVNGFLRFVKEVEGDEYVEDETIARLFQTPEVTMSLRFDDDNTAEILLAPAPDKPDVYYARQDSGEIVSLSGVAVDMLLADSETFRSRELLRFTKQNLSEFEFRHETRSFRIVRRHNAWAATQPEGYQITNQADVETLLNAINPLHALGNADNQPEDIFGLQSPVFEIVLHLDEETGESRQVVLKIGNVIPDNPSERYASSSTRSGVFRISQEVMDEIREAMRGFQ